MKQLGLGSAIESSIDQRLAAAKAEDCLGRSATFSAPTLLEVELKVHQHVKRDIMLLAHEHCLKVVGHIPGLLENMHSNINKSARFSLQEVDGLK